MDEGGKRKEKIMGVKGKYIAIPICLQDCFRQAVFFQKKDDINA